MSTKYPISSISSLKLTTTWVTYSMRLCELWLKAPSAKTTAWWLEEIRIGGVGGQMRGRGCIGKFYQPMPPIYVILSDNQYLDYISC